MYARCRRNRWWRSRKRRNTGTGTAGTANTGGGGGGSLTNGGEASQPGGNGGSGVVIVRFADPSSITWSSNNSSIVAVNSSGVITGGTVAGTATISAFATLNGCVTNTVQYNVQILLQVLHLAQFHHLPEHL